MRYLIPNHLYVYSWVSANSDSFSNSQEVLESCAAPGANNKFGARIRGPELNVKIRQFPFMASYGYLQGN